MADLAEVGELDPVGTSFEVHYTWASDGWAKHVGYAVARYFGCFPVTTQFGNQIFYSISGRQSNRETFEVMFPFILQQVKKEARDIVNSSYVHPTTYSRAKTAVGNALTFRINKLVHERDAKPIVTAKGTALVPVAEIEAAARQAFPDLKMTNSKIGRTVTMAAREAAARVKLNVQVKGGGNAT